MKNVRSILMPVPVPTANCSQNLGDNRVSGRSALPRIQIFPTSKNKALLSRQNRGNLYSAFISILRSPTLEYGCVLPFITVESWYAPGHSSLIRQARILEGPPRKNCLTNGTDTEPVSGVATPTLSRVAIEVVADRSLENLPSRSILKYLAKSNLLNSRIVSLNPLAMALAARISSPENSSVPKNENCLCA